MEALEQEVEEEKTAAAGLRGLVLLECRTPLHCGRRGAESSFLRSILRGDGGVPEIPGTSVLGAIRARALVRVQAGKAAYSAQQVEVGLGQRGGGSGQLSASAARLVALPVRTVRGLFAYVTCPGSLSMLGCGFDQMLPRGEELGNGALASARCCAVLQRRVVLEEFCFELREQAEFAGAGQELAQVYAGVVGEYAAAKLGVDLVCISDQCFADLSRACVELEERCEIDSFSKLPTARGVSCIEYVPAHSLFASELGGDVGEVSGLSWVRALGVGQVQIGSDQNTGRGICAVGTYEVVEGGV